MNKDKVEKHTPSWTYEIAFDVVDVKENRKTNFQLLFSQPKNETERKSIVLDNAIRVKTDMDKYVGVFINLNTAIRKNHFSYLYPTVQGLHSKRLLSNSWSPNICSS